MHRPAAQLLLSSLRQPPRVTLHAADTTSSARYLLRRISRSDFRASIRNCCVQAVARTCANWARRTPPSLNFLGYFTIVKLSDRGVERKPAEVAVIVRV